MTVNRYLFNGELPGRITNIPAGAKVRIRARPDDFTMAYVRESLPCSGTRISKWAIRKESGTELFLLDAFQGVNEWRASHE